MSKNYYSMFRTTSFPVYGRPYPRRQGCANSFSRSAIADDRRVDQFGHLRGQRGGGQQPAVQRVHPRREGDARYQPNPLRGKQIRGAQDAIVAVVPLVAGNIEQGLLGGAAQDRIPRRRGERQVRPDPSSLSAAITTVERGPSRMQPSVLTKITSPAPLSAACRSAAMFTAYDNVLAPATSHGIASTPAAGSPRSSSTAAIPSRRVAATRSANGLTVR